MSYMGKELLTPQLWMSKNLPKRLRWMAQSF